MTAISAADLEVHESGSGTTAVFTHGWLDSAAIWEGVVSELTGILRCISWSLRAHGQSATPPPGNYTRAHALADMDSVVGDAGPPVVLVGHSLGGYLSLAYALRHPDHVSGLVLVAAGPGFRKPEAREQWNQSVDDSAARFEVPEGAEVISKHYDSDVIDSLSEIGAPTLVIVGERDERFAASAAVFEKYLDVRRSLVVPDAGHMVHRDQPAAVASAIEGFVSSL